MRAALLFVVFATSTAVAGPKATITSRMDCANVGDDAKIEKCAICTGDFGTFKTANASCTYPDAKSGGKYRLEQVECPGIGVSEKDVKDCNACVKSGGVFAWDKKDGGVCANRSVDDRTAPVTDAAGCKNGDIVHPIKAKRCTECIKSAVGEFVVSGDNAGRCMTDPLKYAAKYKLPEQSESVGFYASCPGSDDLKADAACRACIAKHDVFLAGKCIKAAQAVKLAAKVASVAVPPAGTVVANGDYEVTEKSSKHKQVIAQTWVVAKFKGDVVFAEEAAHAGKVGAKLVNKASLMTHRRAEPATKYKLTYWVKQAGGGSEDKLNVFIAVAGNSFNAKPTPTKEWSEQTFEFETPKSTASTIPLVLTFSALHKEAGADGVFFVDDVSIVKAP